MTYVLDSRHIGTFLGNGTWSFWIKFVTYGLESIEEFAVNT